MKNKIYIIIERCMFYDGTWSDWHRGWHRKWYDEKHIAEQALKDSAFGKTKILNLK